MSRQGEESQDQVKRGREPKPEHIWKWKRLKQRKSSFLPVRRETLR